MKNQIKHLIKSTNGKFFTLHFVKADGTLRKACAKAKNVGALRGGESTHKFSNSIPYWDVNKKAYRAFNVNRLVKISCGKKILFEG